MIDDSIIKRSTLFRKSLRNKLRDYPGISINLDWPSMSALDDLCYHLRYRKTWSPEETEFFNGVCAQIAEFVYTCWHTFHDRVEARNTSSGIECLATLRKGLFSKSHYILPITQALRVILQEPMSPFPAFGRQYLVASDQTNFIGTFALGACLGISPYGEGPWADKLPGELGNHLKKGVPYLAATTAAYHVRLFGAERGITHNLFSSQLIWPPAGYHGDYCSSTAADGICGFEARAGFQLSNDTLMNLVKYPDWTISSSAIVLLLARVTTSDVRKELTEICSQDLVTSAAGYRRVAIEIARKEGNLIDWVTTRDKARFLLEDRLYLLPMLHLPYESCIKPENRELVNSLVDMDLPKAMDQLQGKTSEGPEYLFQQAMLHQAQRQFEKTEDVFRDIERRHPDFRYSEFYNEWGANALNLKEADRAVNLLETAANTGDRFGRTLNNLALAYIAVNNHEKALVILNRAVECSDLAVTSLLNRAYVNQSLGNSHLAKQDIAEAVSLYPYNRRCISNVMRNYYGNESPMA